MDPGEGLITLKVESSDTVKTIKECVQDQLGILITLQVVTLRDEELKDDCVISDRSIESAKLNIVAVFGKNTNCFVVYHITFG